MSEHEILADEIELQKVFGNKSINHTKLPSEYTLHDFFDMQTWNKIIDFQIKNPEKIKQWQEEDRIF